MYRFANGYGASVIRLKHDDLYEAAVVTFDGDEWEVCYDTPVAGDVIPGLTPGGLAGVLLRIAALEPC